jgi:hypothetical protein
MFDPVQTELEILGPGKEDRVLLPLDGKQGIEVRTGHANERLVYELKVPLAHSERFPYAVGAGSGKTISIGFETPEFDRSGTRNRRERMGRPPGGGEPGEDGMGESGGLGVPGGGMGRHGGGGPGGSPGGGFSMPQPLKLWMRVVLALNPTPEK